LWRSRKFLPRGGSHAPPEEGVCRQKGGNFPKGGVIDPQCFNPRGEKMSPTPPPKGGFGPRRNGINWGKRDPFSKLKGKNAQKVGKLSGPP